MQSFLDHNFSTLVMHLNCLEDFEKMLMPQPLSLSHKSPFWSEAGAYFLKIKAHQVIQMCNHFLEDRGWDPKHS